MTILVGTEPKQTRFVAPRALLCANSKWFETALNNFKEGQDGVVRLPEGTPRAFARFLSWLYRGDFSLPAYEFDCPDDAAKRACLVQECIQIWNLGDMLVLPDLQNTATKKLCLYLFDDMWTCTLTVEAQAAALIETKLHSPLRKLVADYIVLDIQRTGDYTIQKFLCDHEGLLEALLTAQSTSHTSVKGDFPRYKKPWKHRASLFLPLDDGCTYNYDLVTHCSECGYNADIMPLCSICMHRNCTCAGDPEVLLLCAYCIEDHAE